MCIRIDGFILRAALRFFGRTSDSQATQEIKTQVKSGSLTVAEWRSRKGPRTLLSGRSKDQARKIR